MSLKFVQGGGVCMRSDGDNPERNSHAVNKCCVVLFLYTVLCIKKTTETNENAETNVEVALHPGKGVAYKFCNGNTIRRVFHS